MLCFTGWFEKTVFTSSGTIISIHNILTGVLRLHSGLRPWKPISVTVYVELQNLQSLVLKMFKANFSTKALLCKNIHFVLGFTVIPPESKLLA